MALLGAPSRQYKMNSISLLLLLIPSIYADVNALIGRIRACADQCRSSRCYSNCLKLEQRPLLLLNAEERYQVVTSFKCLQCSPTEQTRALLDLLTMLSTSYQDAKQKLINTFDAAGGQRDVPREIRGALREFFGSAMRCYGAPKVMQFAGLDPSEEGIIERIWNWSQTPQSIFRHDFLGPVVYGCDHDISSESVDKIDTSSPVTMISLLCSYMEFCVGKIAECSNKEIALESLLLDLELTVEYEDDMLLVNGMWVKPGTRTCILQKNGHNGFQLYCFDYQNSDPKMIVYEHPSLIDDNTTSQIQKVLTATQAASSPFKAENIEVRPAPLPTNSNPIENIIGVAWLLKNYLLDRDISTRVDDAIDWNRELKVMMAELFTGRIIGLVALPVLTFEDLFGPDPQPKQTIANMPRANRPPMADVRNASGLQDPDFYILFPPQDPSPLNTKTSSGALDKSFQPQGQNSPTGQRPPDETRQVPVAPVMSQQPPTKISSVSNSEPKLTEPKLELEGKKQESTETPSHFYLYLILLLMVAIAIIIGTLYFVRK